MQQEKLSHKIADKITEFSGTMLFLLLNAGLFAVWIIVNTLTSRQFDPFPFQFLTFFVSLEAIFLAIFVLISQNRQVARDRQTSEYNLQVDLNAENKIYELKEQVDRVEKMIMRLCKGN